MQTATIVRCFTSDPASHEVSLDTLVVAGCVRCCICADPCSSAADSKRLPSRHSIQGLADHHYLYTPFDCADAHIPCMESAADTNTMMDVCADPDGQAVESQLVPLAQSGQDLQSTMVKEGLLPSLDHAAQEELVFLAHLPPVGYVTCQSTCLSTYLWICLSTCLSHCL